MIKTKALAFHMFAYARIFTAGILLLTIGSCTKSADDSSDDYVGNWFRSYDFEGVARTEAVSFTIGNYAYVGTGYKKDDTRLSDFWAFDQSTGTWFQKADMPVDGRNSAVAFAINNKGYVGTGYDGTNYLKDFWEYNQDNNSWTKKADFGGSARYGAVGFALNGKGYIGTGYDDNYLKDFWEFDPSNNQWTQKASLAGTKRMDAVAFTINDKAYVCTGINNGAYPDDIYMFDAAANNWTQKRRIVNISDDDYDDDYNILRSNASVFVIDNIAYLSNGSYSGVTGTTWAYDPATDLWAQKTTFESTAREGAIGFSVNSRGYITTGNNSSSRFDDMWEFSPNAEQVDND
jgi:N-acetylneuraminic acid mutarotase